jgi:tRNA-dihydrouridine synthase
MGYEAVDINMGCPEKHVVRNGGGSALIRTPELAGEIMAACKGHGLAVSVKTRVGYSSVEEWREWISFLLRQDLAALTVHLRTKKEMSKVGAHFELVPEIVALRDEVAPGTLLIINGDIRDVEDGRRFVEMGVDGIMIGRGVFADPFCFLDAKHHPWKADPGMMLGKRLELLKLHLDLFDKLGGRSFETLKRFFKVYVNGFEGASGWRERLMGAKNTDDARGIMEEMKEKI